MTGTHYNSLPRGYRLGRFEIEGVLGEGGFGITYKAWDTKLEQPRAIKEYLPGEFAVRIDGSIVRAKSDAHVETFTWGIRRFLKEAQTLARFNHPNIVRVLDFFEQNDTAYMVMDYYDGESLQQRIREGRAPKTEAEILALVQPLLRGLSVVHAANVLHLDIKPANIYIWRDGQIPVLLDFGAARELIAQHSRSAASVYTPGYAAVEQYHESGKRGPWTDIYGMGATLYTLVSGAAPEEAPGRVEDDDMPRAIDVGRGRYSAEFLAAIDASLAVFGKDRPRSCPEWEALLARGSVSDSRRGQIGTEAEAKTVRWDAPTVVSADRRASASPTAVDPVASRVREAAGSTATRPSGSRFAAPEIPATGGRSSPDRGAALHNILGQVSNEEQGRAAVFRKILEEVDDAPKSAGISGDGVGHRHEKAQRKDAPTWLVPATVVLIVATILSALGLWGYSQKFAGLQAAKVAAEDRAAEAKRGMEEAEARAAEARQAAEAASAAQLEEARKAAEAVEAKREADAAVAALDARRTAAAPSSRFVDNGNGTITDTAGRLVWEKLSDDGSVHDKDDRYSWGDANVVKIARLNTQDFAGHRDWRLPTREELESLVDSTRTAPKIERIFGGTCDTRCDSLRCSCTQSDCYWSSSSHAERSTYAWGVYFTDGSAGASTKANKYFVRAVRDGPY